MRVWRRLVVGAAAVAVVAVAPGLRRGRPPERTRGPPAPIEISANITDQRVVISPDEFGAGTVTIVASNQSQDEARLTLDGPTLAESQPIPAGAVGQLKTILEEGDYEVIGRRGVRHGRPASSTSAPSARAHRTTSCCPSGGAAQLGLVGGRRRDEALDPRQAALDVGDHLVELVAGAPWRCW